jgi:uncharacterized protein (TIRG00374 family)
MKYKTTIFLAIGILIMAVMLYFIGVDQIIEALKLANFWFILAAILVQILTYYLFALRWSFINKIAKISIKVTDLLPMVLVGMGINNITPSGRGGGEPVKAYILSKYTNNSYESSFATVVADRALDTIPFLILAIITIFLMILQFNLDFLIITILIATVFIVTIAFILLIYMSVNQKIVKKIIPFMLRIIRIFYKKDPEKLEKRIKGAVYGFQSTMKLMLKDKDVLYKALPLSFIIWGSEILRVYLIFLAFGAQVSPVLITEVFIISCLIGMIPLLPGGLGAVDGMMILLFTSTGISSSISAATTVIERLISFWMTTITGLVLLPYYGYSATEEIKNTSTINESKIINEIEDNQEVFKEIFNKEEDENKIEEFSGDVKLNIDEKSDVEEFNGEENSNENKKSKNFEN